MDRQSPSIAVGQIDPRGRLAIEQLGDDIGASTPTGRQQRASIPERHRRPENRRRPRAVQGSPYRRLGRRRQRLQPADEPGAEPSPALAPEGSPHRRPAASLRARSPPRRWTPGQPSRNRAGKVLADEANPPKRGGRGSGVCSGRRSDCQAPATPASWTSTPRPAARAFAVLGRDAPPRRQQRRRIALGLKLLATPAQIEETHLSPLRSRNDMSNIDSRYDHVAKADFSRRSSEIADQAKPQS